MKVSKDFIMRNIAGECVIVPTGAAAAKFNGMITANEVAEFMWKQLENDITEDELVAAVLDEFEVDEALARRDAKNFIAALSENGFMEE